MVEFIQLLAAITALLTQIVSLVVIIKKLQKNCRSNNPMKKRASRCTGNARSHRIRRGG